MTVLSQLQNALPTLATYMDVQLHIFPLAEACEFVTKTE